jgi:hypothetical protein
VGVTVEGGVTPGKVVSNTAVFCTPVVLQLKAVEAGVVRLLDATIGLVKLLPVTTAGLTRLLRDTAIALPICKPVASRRLPLVSPAGSGPAK